MTKGDLRPGLVKSFGFSINKSFFKGAPLVSRALESFADLLSTLFVLIKKLMQMFFREYHGVFGESSARRDQKLPGNSALKSRQSLGKETGIIF